MSESSFADPGADLPIKEPAPTSDSSLSWIGTFLGALLCPLVTFKVLAESSRYSVGGLPGAFCFVLLVFGAEGMRAAAASGRWADFLWTVAAGSVVWSFSAFCIGMVAFCFGVDRDRIRALVVTLAWSTLPWLFMSPLSCFSRCCGPVVVFFSFLILIWMLLLQVLSVKVSFGLKPMQAFLLVMVVPSLFVWFQFFQFLKSCAVLFGAQ